MSNINIKNLLLLIVFLFSIQIYSQNLNSQSYNKRYTKDAENGFAWNSLSEGYSIAKNYKHDYLASMLENQRLKNMYQKNSTSPIDCAKDISKLMDSDKSDGIDLDAMVKLIDGFYNKEENLIIPIMGAYCYSVKDLAGYNENDLETYRQELLKFSKE